jgi:hypothetical protein
MTTSKNWFKATANDGSDMTPDLLQFAEMIGIERIVPGRYSVLLLLALYGATRAGRLNPAKVLHEIESLEGIRGESSLKPASQFKHPPLKGLWHKHYLQDGLPTMAINLRKGIGKHGLPWLEQQVAEAQASGEEKFLTEQDCARIAHDAVIGNWERLVEESALTGEWIIFAKHQEKNYYLCLGQHNSGDDLLRSQIDSVCLQEYPFLSSILP